MRSVLALVLLIAAAACGGKSSGSSTPPTNAGGGGAGGPPWAAMFEQGHTWKLEVKTSDAFWDDQDPKADANGMVRNESAARAGSCTVAQVVAAADGKAAKLTCDWGPAAEGEMAGNDPFTSWTWFANDTGLYVIAELPAAGAAVAPSDQQLVMGATPAAFNHDLTVQGGEESEGSEMMMLEQKGDAWCWTWGAALGDEMWQTVCFGPDGLRGGDFGWAGGSEHTTTFTVVK